MKRKLFLQIILCFSLFVILSAVCLYSSNGKKTDASYVRSVSEEPGANVKISKYYEAIGYYPSVTKLTERVKRGETAELGMCGVPGKIYNISVYYSSGKSASSVFSPKEADYDGNFSWSWKIPENASVGDVRIVVYNELGYYQLYITVI